MQDAALRHRDLMVSGSVDRAILHLGAPAAAAALLQAGFLVVDTFWLGRVGAVAIAAASTAGFTMWLAQSLGEGLATGSGALLAHGVGAADPEAATRASGAGLALAVWASVLVAAAGIAVTGPLFAFMETAPEVSREGGRYMLVVLLGMPFYFVFAWLAAAFRAAGDARTPMRLLAIAGGVNLVVDPVLIFGPGPLPALGVTGAALATVAAWTTSAAVGWHALRRAGLAPRAADALRPPREVWRALRIGLPLGAEGALFSVIYIVLTRLITDFGTAPVAALGVGHKLELLNYFVCTGMGAAATTLVGQSLGAGVPSRAARAGWRALFLTVVAVGAVTVVLVTWPAAVVSVFIPDPKVVAVGVVYVLLVGMSQPFMAAEVVILGAFAGAHRTAVPAAVEITLTAARIPLAWWLVARGWGVEGVWFAIAATTVAKGTVQTALFAFWQRRSRHLPSAVPVRTLQ